MVDTLFFDSIIHSVREIIRLSEVDVLEKFAKRLKEEQRYFEDECGDFVPFVSVERIDILLNEIDLFD